MDNLLIILTCTVNVNTNKAFLFQTNPDQRLECYLKSIKQWLDNSSFRICVVENSGYIFPELEEYLIKYNNRFEIISYDESTLMIQRDLANYLLLITHIIIPNLNHQLILLLK